MGALPFLLVAGCLLLSHFAQALEPLLASSNIVKYNPTTTTITLEKPYCFFTSTKNLTVYLYVAQADAASNLIDPTNTYSSTDVGRLGPYAATKFDNPNCVGIPTTSDIYDATKADTVLNQYVVRVGNDETCFDTPTVCNRALRENTAYRFLYLFSDGTSFGWSAPVKTRQARSLAAIDTWPGGRSGGMIVITSILSVMMFLILAGLVAAVITNFMTPSSSLAPTEHESRTSHSVPQKTDTEYSTALGGGSERYSTNP